MPAQAPQEYRPISTAHTDDPGLVIALSGGIGGAKLALGLSHILDPADLLIVANTGDDFEHLGLGISPDLDTVMYTLAGLDNATLGWGRKDESWAFMAALAALGGETWFQLGDRDLATHVERTRRLASGETLSAITADFCRRLGVAPRLLPMSDQRVRTRLETDEGWLEFQEYFVHRHCAPKVRAIAFAGADQATPNPALLTALSDPRLAAIVICPSNPFISIDPILAVPGLRQALRDAPAPVIAISPIIAGAAVKGPTAKMMAELGLDPGAAEVAHRYGDLLDGYVADHLDAAATRTVAVPVLSAPTLMTDLATRIALARATLDFATELRGR